MKRLIFGLMVSTLLIAQIPDGQAVNQSAGSPPTAIQTLAYNNAGLIQYICKAASRSKLTTIVVSSPTAASSLSFTATAHNLGDYTNLPNLIISPIVMVSGFTGAWSPANGVWAATITSANAFTIPVNSSGFGAVAGTPTVTTYCPRLNNLVWAIQQLFYDGSNNFIGSAWAGSAGGAGSTNLTTSSTGGSFACSSRATLAYQ
jgi:hypothetical protein